jgi:hypothetical protein
MQRVERVLAARQRLAFALGVLNERLGAGSSPLWDFEPMACDEMFERHSELIRAVFLQYKWDVKVVAEPQLDFSVTRQVRCAPSPSVTSLRSTPLRPALHLRCIRFLARGVLAGKCVSSCIGSRAFFWHPLVVCDAPSHPAATRGGRIGGPMFAGGGAGAVRRQAFESGRPARVGDVSVGRSRDRSEQHTNPGCGARPTATYAYNVTLSGS